MNARNDLAHLRGEERFDDSIAQQILPAGMRAGIEIVHDEEMRGAIFRQQLRHIVRAQFCRQSGTTRLRCERARPAPANRQPLSSLPVPASRKWDPRGRSTRYTLLDTPPGRSVEWRIDAVRCRFRATARRQDVVSLSSFRQSSGFRIERREIATQGLRRARDGSTNNQ